MYNIMFHGLTHFHKGRTDLLFVYFPAENFPFSRISQDAKTAAKNSREARKDTIVSGQCYYSRTRRHPAQNRKYTAEPKDLRNSYMTDVKQAQQFVSQAFG